MYANLGPGHVAELVPPSSNATEVLYDHEYVAQRMQTQNSLYAYAINNPLSMADPDGLKPVDTGVKSCTGYQKGDWLWGWFPSHAFIMMDGMGYGRFECHLNVCGTAEIRENDQQAYPERDDPHPGDWYSVCKPIVYDDTVVDIQAFRKCVKDYIAQQTADPGTYVAGIRDCFSFRDTAIAVCFNQARKNKHQGPIPYPPEQKYPARPTY